MKKLVFGVGKNDADYMVTLYEGKGYKINGKEAQKRIWICPYYARWKAMLQRCYDENFIANNPTYEGCSVFAGWMKFVSFRKWMEEQDWQGKELDKDILQPGNRVYSPEKCVFVDAKINTFLNDQKKVRGGWPIGVSLEKKTGKLRAQCREVETGKVKNLGRFECQKTASQAWLSFKLQQARILATQQDDPRVAKALIDRYENYCIEEAAA